MLSANDILVLSNLIFIYNLSLQVIKGNLVTCKK